MPAVDETEESAKALYDLSKEVFAEEIERLSRIDSKAARYLTLLTFLIGLLSLLGRFGIREVLPPESILDMVTVLLVVFVFATLVFAAAALFWALHMGRYKKIPIDIPAFRDNALKDVYISYAYLIEDGLKENRQLGAHKAYWSVLGFRLVAATFVGLALVAICLFAKMWHHNSPVKDEISPTTINIQLSLMGNENDNSDSSASNANSQPGGNIPPIKIKPMDTVSEAFSMPPISEIKTTASNKEITDNSLSQGPGLDDK